MPSAFPGTYETFLAYLPASLRTVSESDLKALYHQAQENAAIAEALESKRETLAGILTALRSELESQGLTLDALLAFEREERGAPAFHPGTPDYLLPRVWRSGG